MVLGRSLTLIKEGCRVRHHSASSRSLPIDTASNWRFLYLNSLDWSTSQISDVKANEANARRQKEEEKRYTPPFAFQIWELILQIG